ncbi:MAG: hypothetical protein WC807_08815 [Hyphomicrobium sp.]|jgi:hypothetical protein|nr:MAG: hypothetical protein B7Z29_15025 [Hyphomicrobium sp. 12-62-95]OYX98491.1 MAG: hypothetical protein B7Y80_15805 [Hyphomicrobium sp. 32-62-53]
MRIEALFWVSLLICVVSFILFVLQVVGQALLKPRSAEGAGGAQQQSLDPGEALKKIGEAAQSFAKAGPISTSAVLCALFGLFALVTSGIVRIGPE